MAKIALLSCLYLGTAWGSAIGERTTSTCKTEGFDLPISVAGGAAPVVFARVDQGTYGELSYSGASRVNMDHAIIPGVSAHSKPNTAIIGTTSTALQFILSLLFGTKVVGVENVAPSTTITPVAGKVKSFDLKSVWVGCGTTPPEVLSLSLPCTVFVTGTDVYGNAKSTETIGFGPDQVYNSTMGFFKFDGWNEMVSVRMTVDSSSLLVGPTILFFDDFAYCPRYG